MKRRINCKKTKFYERANRVNNAFIRVKIDTRDFFSLSKFKIPIQNCPIGIDFKNYFCRRKARFETHQQQPKMNANSKKSNNRLIFIVRIHNSSFIIHYLHYVFPNHQYFTPLFHHAHHWLGGKTSAGTF